MPRNPNQLWALVHVVHPEVRVPAFFQSTGDYASLDNVPGLATLKAPATQNDYPHTHCTAVCGLNFPRQSWTPLADLTSTCECTTCAVGAPGYVSASRKSLAEFVR